MDHENSFRDDDLFINQAATNKNTAILYTPESFTFSEPKLLFHLGCTKKEDMLRLQITTKDLINFSWDYFSLVSFVFSFCDYFVSLSIPMDDRDRNYRFRYLFTWISLGYAAGKLKKKRCDVWYPIIEIVLIFTQLSVFLETSSQNLYIEVNSVIIQENIEKAKRRPSCFHVFYWIFLNEVYDSC